MPLSETQQSTAREQMRQVGLRPTRQRVALAGLLFSGPDRHITAEQLHGEALAGQPHFSPHHRVFIVISLLLKLL